MSSRHRGPQSCSPALGRLALGGARWPRQAAFRVSVPLHCDQQLCPWGAFTMTGGVTGRPGGPSSCENSQRAHPNHSIRRPQPVLARAPPSASITCVTQKGAGALLGPPARARPLGRPGPEDRVFLPRGTVHRSRQGPTAPYRTHGSWARTGCQQAGLGAHTLPSHSCPTAVPQTQSSTQQRAAAPPRGLAPAPRAAPGLPGSWPSGTHGSPCPCWTCCGPLQPSS